MSGGGKLHTIHSIDSNSNTWIIKMPTCKTTGKEYVIKDAKDAKFVHFAGKIAKEIFDARD